MATASATCVTTACITPNTDQLDADEDGVGDLCTAIGC